LVAREVVPLRRLVVVVGTMVVAMVEIAVSLALAEAVAAAVHPMCVRVATA
jgi:hypothetical protein